MRSSYDLGSANYHISLCLFVFSDRFRESPLPLVCESCESKEGKKPSAQVADAFGQRPGALARDVHEAGIIGDLFERR